MAGAPNMDGEQITILRTSCPYALYPSPIRLSGYLVFGIRTFGVRFVHIHTRRLVTVSTWVRLFVIGQSQSIDIDLSKFIDNGGPLLLSRMIVYFCNFFVHVLFPVTVQPFLLVCRLGYRMIVCRG